MGDNCSYKDDIGKEEEKALVSLDDGEVEVLPPPRPQWSRENEERLREEFDFALSKYETSRPMPGFRDACIFYAHQFDKDVQEMTTFQRRERVAQMERDLICSLLRRLLYNGVLLDEDVQVITSSEAAFVLLNKVFEDSSTFSCVDLLVADYLQRQEDVAFMSILYLTNDNAGYDDKERFVVALKRAMDVSTNGLIIICSEDILQNSTSSYWKLMMDAMQLRGWIQSYIPIQCLRHNQHQQVRTAENFRLAPFGGCSIICLDVVCTDHKEAVICNSPCHPLVQDHDDFPFNCLTPCERRCRDGHPCEKPCGKGCRCRLGDCLFPRPGCGHIDNGEKDCSDKCDYTYPCGLHTCKMVCHECDKVHRYCQMPCEKFCAGCKNPCTGAHSCHSKCPPCNQKIEYCLPCGHQKSRPCSEPAEETVRILSSFRCQQECMKHFAVCVHKCEKECWEECGECEKLIAKKNPCGHTFVEPCHSKSPCKPCENLVESPHPALCGHKVEVPCSLRHSLTQEEVIKWCVERCGGTMMQEDGFCGHMCLGTCVTCRNGRFHVRCTQTCRKLLICGHECRSLCSMSCPPCGNPCLTNCSHHQCLLPCGAPCTLDCTEPCDYSCPHFTCRKTCGEICDREGCLEPCPLTLTCGHPCVGFCGEECPTACGICSPEKLQDVLALNFAMSDSEDEDEETKRFVMLPSCGHCIESTGLEHWFAAGTDDNEIRLKCCPFCRRPVPVTFRRFSKYIMPAWTLFEEVKNKIFGTEDAYGDLATKIQESIELQLEGKPKFGSIATVLSNELSDTVMGYTRDQNNTNELLENTHELPSRVTLGKMHCIEWVCSEWINIEQRLVSHAIGWPDRNFTTFTTFCETWLQMVCEREWPLTSNEVKCLLMEKQRLADFEMLYNRVSLNLENRSLYLAYTEEGQTQFNSAELILKRHRPYVQSDRKQFMDHLRTIQGIQTFALNIPDSERLAIVTAFGGRSGRWFKCPNGHVYVVTECGGVTEVGVCNECGEVIGGENHQEVRTNYLATEMDGAERPMYPTALQRGDNNDGD